MVSPAARPVILAINPCHVTPPEHAFWRSVAGAARRRGWTLVQVATRLLPETEDSWSVSLPARLSELDHRLRAAPMRRPDWLPAEHLAVLEDWECRRWRLDQRLPAALSGLMRLASYVERALKELRPAVVLTLNKIDHPLDLFRRASLAHGIPAAVVERSPLDGIWLEPEGLFAESEIWTRYTPPDAAQLRPGDPELRDLESLRSNPASFRATAADAESTLEFLRTLPRPLVFLPMDNVLWTGWEQPFHPLAVVDNPLYPDPHVALTTVHRHVEALGGSLLVKKHPACLAIDEATIPPGAHFVSGDLGTMLQEADVVAAFNTKVAFPALAMGKPVVTMAPNPVARSGATYHAASASEVPRELAAAVRKEALDEKLALFPPFLGWLRNDYFYRCEDDEDGPEEERGPRRFCADVIAMALPPNEGFTEAEREALTPTLLAAPASPPQRPPGDQRASSLPGSPPGGAAPRSSLIRKGLVALRSGGPRELARKGMIWALSRLEVGRLEGVVRWLERKDVDLRELKARHPYLVRYRRQWLGPAPGEESAFERAWRQGLPSPSRVHATGCSPEALARLASVRDRHADESLAILLGQASEAERSVASTALTMVTSRAALTARPNANFFCTLDWNQAKELAASPAGRRTAVWLPQAFFGLLPEDSDVHWFGTVPSGRRLSDDLAEVGVVDGGGVIACVHVAVHLGFRKIDVFGPVAEPEGRRLRELADGSEIALRFQA